MIQSAHYIQWQKNKHRTLDEQIAEVMKHWESRYELGTALILCDKPAAALKLVQKQWRKLTIQAQKTRESNVTAEEILDTTRIISRMQRIKFSSKSPADTPDAALYIASPAELAAFPSRCFTLYSLTTLPDIASLALLPPEALVVAYQEPCELKGFYNKSVVEERVQTEEAALLKWLEQHHIDLKTLSGDMEKTNEALDTLLSSNSLQSEFLHKTQLFLHILQLACPLRLSETQQKHLNSLKRLEKHVRILSPSFLSDHILDSSSDDSFLLRELSTKNILTLEALKSFISSQHRLGRTHLASALEQKAGFVRV